MQPSGITVQPTFQRWINTLPFWLGLGVAIYFQLPHEPPMWLLAGLLVFLLLLWVTKVNQRLFAITLVVTIVACGVGAGIVQTDRVGGPVLKKPLNAVMLEGRVRDIVIDGKRQKMTLDSLRIDGLAPEETPLKIRVSAALGAQEIGIGQFISLRGWLAPPSRPVMPGGFDFGRFFYFRQIGAIGFVIPPVQVLPASQHEPHWQTYLSDWMAKERLRLKRYFVEVLPEPSSSLTVAYVIGDSSGISEEIQNNMRAAGLSHIIAISGMHLTIVCGFIYFLVRLILALIPWIATRADIRKPAAWLALLSGILYLWLADFPISAVRAYVMIAIYFSAILLGREADGLRSLALAAIVILLVQPSSLLEPGFQLSFAAVLALILYYRWWAKRRETEFWEKSSWLRHMGIYFLGIAATSLVAGLATAPIAAYHFHQFASYGLLANMLCIPLVSFIVTPALMLGLVLAPFDMSEGCMHIVSWGFDTMVWIGAQAAALPGALLPIAPLAGWGAALMAVGGVIFLLPQRRLKIAAMMAVIAGLATALLYQPPDMLISGDGKAIAMRQGEQWSILRGTPRNFAIKEWQLALNVTMQPGIVDRCDRSGCVQPIGSHLFAMPRYERAVAEDCLMADIVVSEKSYSAPCRAALLDGEALRRNGSHALRFSGKQVIIEHGCSQVAARPWNRCQTLKSAK